MPPNSDPTFKMKTIVWFVLVLGPLIAAGEVVVVKQGETATINCWGDTKPANPNWKHGQELLIGFLKNGTPLRGQSDTARRSSLKQGKLVISNVNKKDAGKLTCVADGKTHLHTLLVVSASVSPSGELKPGSQAKLQCQVYDPNPVDKVHWKKPDDKPTESHIVELNPVELSDAGTWKCEFPWDKQTKNVSLHIKVKAPEPTTVSPSKTSEGNKKTCNNCDSTSKKSNDSGLLGLSLWVWVGIGVGGLVTISLMVVVIVLYKRIKRRKERHRRLKNSRQPLTPRQYCECDHPTAAAKPQQGRRREKTLLME